MYKDIKSIMDTKNCESEFGMAFLEVVNLFAGKWRMIIVAFYASKLSLTPKYLSKVIRQNSGKTAGEWIEEYVILEAKALLKSTNKTIQQITDELNFSTQSFFGKYFKRRVGLSPKEYRVS